MCESGARNQNFISGLLRPVAGIEKLPSIGEVFDADSNSSNYRDPGVAASQQLASQPKLKNTLCEWRAAASIRMSEL
jgi:hypothetical protein